MQTVLQTLTICFAFLSAAACLAEVPATKAEAEKETEHPVCLPGTEQVDLQSREGLDYRILIATPQQAPPQAGYRLLVLLDGHANFAAATALYRLQQRASTLAPTIIVGVGYPSEAPIDMERRTFDMTPPAEPKKLPPRRGGNAWPEHGGADLFADFLKNTLKPWLHDRYSIDSSQEALFGHSFGGLFVMHCLATAPETFDCYLAASPALWWNDYALGDPQWWIKSAQLDSKTRLLITVGELELSEDGGPASLLAPTPARKKYGNTRKFAGQLLQRQPAGLSIRYQEFPRENHGSVIPLAINEALRFALKQDEASTARE